MANTNAEFFRIRNIQRQLCRTDIFTLAKILNYPDVCPEVHQPIVDILPKLLGGRDVEVAPGVFEYKPYKEIWQMPGPREFLVMYPRGHLKTTLVSQTYLIQCILNWPDIRILLSCATGDQVERVVRAVRGVFQYNDDFRTLFPEFCPQNADEFGSSQQFVTPARKIMRGEPTVFSVTVGKTIAGYHPDMIFHSDLVDKENVKTPGGINDVINHFDFMEPLLERYSAKDGYPATRGFTFVEGTPYDFGDLHNKLMADKTWQKVIKPAQEDYPFGKILWPSRFPQEELDRMCKKNQWLFSAQYLMKCVPQGDGLCDPKDVAFVKPEVIGSLMPTLRMHCTIDLAGMEVGRSGDYTVLTIGGFDRDGRLYIVDIRRGHFPPEEVIAHIFDIHHRYPQIIDFKIEKDAHARVLLPFLQREMSKLQRFPIMVPLKRDNHKSKQDRIRALRPWFKTGIIRFSGAIKESTQLELLSEIGKFPSQSYGVHDDILDTLADMMQNSEGGVTDDVVADAPDMKFAFFGKPRPKDRFLGFGEGGVAEWLYGNDPDYRQKISKTGFLD